FQAFDGGRTRARTLDPLIKSQLLYQLSYAPIELAGPGPGKARHVAKAGWAVQPKSGGKFRHAPAASRLRAADALADDVPYLSQARSLERFPRPGPPRPRPRESVGTAKSYAASVQRAFFRFLFLMSFLQNGLSEVDFSWAGRGEPGCVRSGRGGPVVDDANDLIDGETRRNLAPNSSFKRALTRSAMVRRS